MVELHTGLMWKKLLRGFFNDGGLAVNPLEEKGVNSLGKDYYESLRTSGLI
jgi:hypothetical protein